MHNRWWKLLLAAALGYLALRFLLAPLLPFVIALGTAVLLEPAVRWGSRRLGLRRGFVAVVLTTVLLGLLLAVLGWGTIRLWREAAGWLEELPRALEALPALMERAEKRYEGFLRSCPREVRSWLEGALAQLSEEGISLAGELSGKALGWASSAAAGVPQLLLFLFTTILAAYLTTMTYPEITAFLRRQTPKRWQHALHEIAACFRSTFWKWLKAESFLCFVTFVMLLLGFWYMKLEYALLAAVLVALVDALPVLGAGTVLVPWGLYHILLDSVPMGVALLALYAMILLVRSLLEPRVMAAQAGLPPLTALLAMYVGFSFFGVGGMLLLPVLLLFFKQLHDSGVFRLWM